MSQYVGRALQFGCLMLLLFLSGREAYCVSEASLQGPRTKGTQTPTVVERPVYFQILYACGTFTPPLAWGTRESFSDFAQNLAQPPFPYFGDDLGYTFFNFQGTEHGHIYFSLAQEILPSPENEGKVPCPPYFELTSE